MCGSTWDRHLIRFQLAVSFVVMQFTHAQACVGVIHSLYIHMQDLPYIHMAGHFNLLHHIIIGSTIQMHCLSLYNTALYYLCGSNQVTPEGSFLRNFRCRLFLLQMPCVYMRSTRSMQFKMLVCNTASRNHCGVTNRIFGISAKTIGLNVGSHYVSFTCKLTQDSTAILKTCNI